MVAKVMSPFADSETEKQKLAAIQNDFMANRLIAISYQNLGDDDNTLKYLMAAKDAAPDTVLCWIELGYYFSRKKEYDKAAEQFKGEHYKDYINWWETEINKYLETL